jgi:hypothetical protein
MSTSIRTSAFRAVAALALTSAWAGFVSPLTGVAAAQNLAVPDNHVMTYRLLGTWQTDRHDYVFQPKVGIPGKAPPPGLTFRKLERGSQKELERGPLQPVHVEGLLSGRINVDLQSYNLKAWVDDRGRLWMRSWKGDLTGDDGKFYARKPVVVDEALNKRWTGLWQTNRGVLEVAAEGSNFAAYIIRDGGRKERVAFSANSSQATGAWDTEYNSSGVWEHKPVDWGDLQLTLSPDGQSFTGWYTARKAGAVLTGMARHEWTGRRTQAAAAPPAQSPASTPSAPTPGGLDDRARNLLGEWFTPFGRVNFIERKIAGVLLVGGSIRDPDGKIYLLSYTPGQGDRLQLTGAEGSLGYLLPFAMSGDRTAFEVRGERLGVTGSWRATRTASEQEQPAPQQPAPEQPSLEEVEATVARLKGDWTSPFGVLRFNEFDNQGIKNLEAVFKDPNTGVQHRLYFTTNGGFSLVTFPDGKTDKLLLLIANDGQSFSAEGKGVGPAGIWRAFRRASSDSGQQQQPQQPAPQQPAPQQPAPQQPAPQQPAPQVPQVPAQNPPPVAAAFKPLNRVDVRVDRVVVARGYPTHQVHVYVTMKNTSASPQYHTGWLKVVLADADGVSWERSQPYSASREPAALFAETPVIQPGGELRSRYIFTPEVDAQLSTLTLSEGGKSAVFPVSLQR